MTSHGATFSIGQFSRLTQLSVRMLRHYHEHGVLAPAFVAPDTGYRYYSITQLRIGAHIRDLRDVGMPVSDMKHVVNALGDPEAMSAVLRTQRDQIVATLDQATERLARIDALMTQLKEHALMNITQRTLPAHAIVALRSTIPTYADEHQLWQQMMGTLMPQHMAAIDRSTPSGARFYDEGFQPDNPDVEIFVPVNAPLALDAPITYREQPAVDIVSVTHNGSYETISEAITQLGEHVGAQNLSVNPHMINLYHVGPGDMVDPAEYVTEVAFELV